MPHHASYKSNHTQESLRGDARTPLFPDGLAHQDRGVPPSQRGGLGVGTPTGFCLR